MALLIVFSATLNLSAQSVSFETESDVITYMDGKKFYNAQSGMQIQYGYISEYNTYGIKVTNKSDAVFYFINVSIDAFGRSADLYGMSPSTGDNFGFRLFQGKLVVGYGEPESADFILR